MKKVIFTSMISWKYFKVLPSIIILGDEPRYVCKNFSIEVGWLGFHAKVTFFAKNPYEECFKEGK